MKATLILAVMFVLPIVSAQAQDTDGNEGRLHRDFRVEKEALGVCARFNFSSLMDCGQTLVMGQPVHVTVGSLAPQNGIAAGLAFVEHKNFANEWRTSFNIDVQATGNGSWRVGGYMKAFRLPSGSVYRVAPLFNLYSQTTSLTRVDYYGLGPNSQPSAHTTFGFTENITGVDAALPLGGALQKARIAIVAELNGRFPSVRAGTDRSLPSSDEVFNVATAPGLARQVPYLQLSEGLRIDPPLFKDHIRLNYLIEFQQFVAVSNSTYSFRRFNADFGHEIPLYRILPGKLGAAYYSNREAQFSHNGPDDCTGSSGAKNISHSRAAVADAHPNPARPCPIISTTEKLEGSIKLRAFLSESFANQGSTVPFYLSPTIGGSDLNGTAMLSSYPDYRFRGPDLLLFRATIEHSIGKLPLGGIFSVDEGKIGLRRDDVSFDHLRHSFSAGVTIHAGGLPVIDLRYSWGGNEGSHTAATISPALLGGSGRPSLF